MFGWHSSIVKQQQKSYEMAMLLRNAAAYEASFRQSPIPKVKQKKHLNGNTQSGLIPPPQRDKPE